MAGIVTGAKRPRNLSHWHAGPLLFGDWGTSRLYVLGLAAVGLGLAAPYYLLALSVLMALVAWAYTIVCRSFQDGGGVYSAARQLSPLLSVIGATLLLADYIVTASLSLVEAFAYLGVPGGNKWLIVGLCGGTVAVLGLINWFGARSAGELAKWIAVASIALSAVVAVLVLPWVPEGLRLMRMDNDPMLTRWVHFTGIILALSGVEAVANMTGIMKEPVPRTANKTIWPVLGEVAVLNLVFGVALLGLVGLSAANLPAMAGGDAVASIGWERDEIKTHAMKVLAIEGGQHWFGQTAGFVFGKATAIVFGLLLISAANTVIGGMVSVMYALGRDDELPKGLTGLNYSGMPKWPLLVACVAPVVLLCFYYELEPLSHLYAIGVTGAIALNLSCCAVNRRLVVTRWERAGLWCVAGIISAVFFTIAATKHEAAIFCGGLIVIVLCIRLGVKQVQAQKAARALPEPEIGWLAELQRTPLEIDAGKPRVMLAARGRYQAEFAVDMARRRGGTLFAIYVRTLRIVSVGASAVPRIEEDAGAQEALGTVAVLARQYRVPFVPIYVISPDIPEDIVDYTVTYGCDTLIMGKSRRSSMARSLEGDVVGKIAALLPEGVSLITRDASPHPMGPVPGSEVVKGGGERF